MCRDRPFAARPSRALAPQRNLRFAMTDVRSGACAPFDGPVTNFWSTQVADDCRAAQKL